MNSLIALEKRVASITVNGSNKLKEIGVEDTLS